MPALTESKVVEPSARASFPGLGGSTLYQELSAFPWTQAALMVVQLVWGADDPTFPVEYARRMVRQLPDARLVEIPGGRLLVHEEKPADVARAVLGFLD